MKTTTALHVLALAALCATPALAQDKEVDNGTDPTKVSSAVQLKLEHLKLNGGFNSDTFRAWYTMPLGEKKNYSLVLKLPVASVDVFGNDNYALGDVSVQLGHVFGLTKEGGYVAQGELIFDTAKRPELGTGKHVFKGTFIVARFLEHGIFAPAFVQSNSLGGDKNRAKVNATTLDFYYVPKMTDPRNLVTLDPSLNFDWENKLKYGGLAVTVGRVIGPAFGGNAILLAKPSVLIGGDRPAKWGIELTYKVIGF